MTEQPHKNRGFGRVLVAIYAVFALAATGRSILQISQTWPDAPMAYWLSAVAAVIYLVATVALASRRQAMTTVALVTVTIELLGVIAVGIWSYADPSAFAITGDGRDTTVWSKFGQGYGYVPLFLPMVGLWWLRRTSGAREPKVSLPQED